MPATDKNNQQQLCKLDGRAGSIKTSILMPSQDGGVNATPIAGPVKSWTRTGWTTVACRQLPQQYSINSSAAPPAPVALRYFFTTTVSALLHPVHPESCPARPSFVHRGVERQMLCKAATT
jgi:hypothetical protein